MTDIVPTQTTLGENYGAQFFGFSSVAARYVELQINACPNPGAGGGYNGCAIGEVAFESTVPEPSTWVLIGCGFAAVAFMAKSRKARPARVLLSD